MGFHENKPIDDANEENSGVFVKMMNIVRHNDNFLSTFFVDERQTTRKMRVTKMERTKLNIRTAARLSGKKQKIVIDFSCPVITYCVSPSR